MTGLPAVPLDDSYIHFQFARSFAEGQPFVYSPGAVPVAGATSLLWPLLLALPQLLRGARRALSSPGLGRSGFLALGLLAYETARAAEGIIVPRLAWVAGVLALAFSANTWFAASGMEVVPLGLSAHALLRGAPPSGSKVNGRASGSCLLLALLAPAMRPEGALGSAHDRQCAVLWWGSKTRVCSALLCFFRHCRHSFTCGSRATPRRPPRSSSGCRSTPYLRSAGRCVADQFSATCAVLVDAARRTIVERSVRARALRIRRALALPA